MDGYYPAKAGKTIFPFALELSPTLPSSYVSKIGGVRYVVSGVALIKSNNRKVNLAHNRFAQVYERWSQSEVDYARIASVTANNLDEVQGETQERISMSAELTKAMVAAGGLVYVKALVNNLGKKTVSGLKLSLWQQVSGNNDLTRTDSGGRLATVDNRVLVTEAMYRGPDWAIPSSESRELVVALGVPPSCYSLRNTALIQVTYEVQVDLITSFCKWKPLRLPLYIAHPSSWSDLAPNISQSEPQSFKSPSRNSIPINPLPKTEFNQVTKSSRRVSLLGRKETIRRKARPDSIGTLCEPTESNRMILRVTNPDEMEESDVVPDMRKRASSVGGLTSRPSMAQHRRQSTLGAVRSNGLRTVSESLEYTSDTSSLIEIGDRILTQHGLRPSFEGSRYRLDSVPASRRSVTIKQLEELQEQIELPENVSSESESDDGPETFHDCQEGEENEPNWKEDIQRLDQHMYPIVAQEDYCLNERTENLHQKIPKSTTPHSTTPHSNRLLKKNTHLRVKLDRSDTVASIQKKLSRLQHQMDTVLTLMDTEPLPSLTT
ncbi:hypothetical protein K7432_007019 [Basidiobolus ranarum]|uniref:Arrestin C-terminal-like domain-containing protein n=1 Tax=Basidiobolus ranarum TaxID=34480 RepID=A0ABR2W0Q3_9FUNG